MIRRNYFTTSEVDTATEAQAALAEKLIDDYVGYQNKFLSSIVRGEVSAVSNSNKTISDTASGTQLDQTDNIFEGCIIEIIGGTGKGQSRIIESSSKTAKSVTVTSAFTTQPDSTSVFRIYQLAKFPRQKDVDLNRAGDTYYKTIPEAVREAAKAQCQFIIEMGDEYFIGDDSEMDSENIMSYGYSRGGNTPQSAVVKFVSPQSRVLLRGIKNRTGKLVR